MLNPDFRDMLSGFIAGGVDFLIVGAYALSAHGLPRATGDLDLWIHRTQENAARVLHALQEFGAPTANLTTADLLAPNQVLQIGIEPNRIDILNAIDGVEFEEAWAERMITRIDRLDVPILSRQHLIVNKRAVGRPRDLSDLAALEAEQERRLDGDLDT